MKLPNKIKIGGHEYNIKLVEPSKLEDGNCGMIDRDKGEIYISKNLIRSEQEVTFFHEVIHIINSALSEEQTDSFAQSIYSLLKNNNLLK